MSTLKNFQELFENYQRRLAREAPAELRPEIQKERRAAIQADLGQHLDALARKLRQEIPAIRERRTALQNPVLHLLQRALHEEAKPADLLLAQVLPSLDVAGLESMATLLGGRPHLALLLRQELTGRPHEEFGDTPHGQAERKAKALAAVDGNVKPDAGAIVRSLEEEREAERLLWEYEESTSKPGGERKLSWATRDAALSKAIEEIKGA